MMSSSPRRRKIAQALGVTHLDLLVATGEITEDELADSGKSGIVDIDPDDPRRHYVEINSRMPVDSVQFDLLEALFRRSREWER